MTTETTKRQFALQLWKSQGGPLTVLWRTLTELVQRPFYPVYERALTAAADGWNKPQHIGIIMDGNRRFARQVGASSVAFGHQIGADKLREMLDWCFEQNIPVVTVWGFSLENFHRDSQEVTQLLELFERKTREMVTSPDLHDNQVRVRFIGRRDLLPESLQDAIREVECATGHYQKFVLNIALAYGGREEIADAFLEYLNHSRTNGKSLEQVIEEFAPKVVDRYLYTSGLPEPDLIIRTSGEVRLSGFMLWQSANSEYYFCDTNWPAFRKIDFLRALRSYDQRQRRFGK